MGLLELVKVSEPSMKELEEIIVQLAGATSLCWTPKPKGVFDSRQATKFVDEAIKQIEKLIAKEVNQARINELEILHDTHFWEHDKGCQEVHDRVAELEKQKEKATSKELRQDKERG